MKLHQELIAAALALSLVPAPVWAMEQARLEQGTAAAESLYELGLMKGAGVLPDGSPDFQLERSATRGEGLAMLVRLLGAEQDATAGNYTHPFTDAGWADDYCGYAYTHQIANGVSPTAFGTGLTISRDHFLTLVMRALGYAEVDWRNPGPLAAQVGLVWPATEDFSRCDMAVICLSALDCLIKDTDQTLRDRLLEQGAIPALPSDGGETQPVRRTPGPMTQAVYSARVSSKRDLLPELVKLMEGRASTVWLEVPPGQEKLYSDYVGQLLEALPDVAHWGFSWYEDSGKLNMELTFQDEVRIMAYLEGKTDSLSQLDREVLSRAVTIRDSLITADMTDYQIVRAFHDYLVDHTSYRDTGRNIYDAAGPLIDGMSVCDGYSKAFDLLCYLVGIDCIRISGTADGGLHAWNKVKVDGVWYNVDVTWDDPVSSHPVLRHDYFLVSDTTLSEDHQWTPYPHWPACLSDYPA